MKIGDNMTLQVSLGMNWNIVFRIQLDHVVDHNNKPIDMLLSNDTPHALTVSPEISLSSSSQSSSSQSSKLSCCLVTALDSTTGWVCVAGGAGKLLGCCHEEWLLAPPSHDCPALLSGRSHDDGPPGILGVVRADSMMFARVVGAGEMKALVGTGSAGNHNNQHN